MCSGGLHARHVTLPIANVSVLSVCTRATATDVERLVAN